jgi:hypothetical protein
MDGSLETVKIRKLANGLDSLKDSASVHSVSSVFNVNWMN